MLNQPRKRLFLIALTLMWVARLSIPAFAYVYSGDYLPWAPKTLGQTFPLECVVKDAKEGDSFHLSPNIRCKVKDGEMQLSGRTHAGKNWHTHTHLGFGATIWKGDLDVNGHEDISCLYYTGSCGIAPGQCLITVLFDDQLVPHIYEVTGYFETVDHKLDDLRKYRGRQGAILVVQSLSCAKGNSYWRNTAYECRKCGWVPLKTLNGLALPAYTHYTFKRPHRSVARVKPDEKEARGLIGVDTDSKVIFE